LVYIDLLKLHTLNFRTPIYNILVDLVNGVIVQILNEIKRLE